MQTNLLPFLVRNEQKHNILGHYRYEYRTLYMFVISSLKTMFTAFTAPDGVDHIELASKRPNYLKL